jgi:hypothetical protein
MEYRPLSGTRLLEITLELRLVRGDRVADTSVAFVSSPLCGNAEQCGTENKDRTYHSELKDRAHRF